MALEAKEDLASHNLVYKDQVGEHPLHASLVHSHWSRLNEAQLSLVEMVHSVAPLVSLMP